MLPDSPIISPYNGGVTSDITNGPETSYLTGDTQQIPQREVAYYVHFLREPVVIEHKEEQQKSRILIEK